MPHSGVQRADATASAIKKTVGAGLSNGHAIEEKSTHKACPFSDAQHSAEQPDWCPDKFLSSGELIDMEAEYAAHNYHPMPIVFERAEGAYVWDPEGKRYYDFLACYSAVNQGHRHPKIIEAMIYQAQKCTLSSRAFYNSVFPRFAKYITEFFGYEMVLPMNSGAEAVETALKMARKWGYEKKGIPLDQAIVISAKGCFHGRTHFIISMSNDPDCRVPTFGPFAQGVMNVEYDDADALEAILEKHGKNVCCFIVEPIQGEAGVVVPKDGYLARCADLCKKHNVLFIADEIQTGLARTGKMLCTEWDNVRADVLILGKALSGGTMPVSAVLADKDIMLCIKPGQHGSTFGGNPMAAAVAIASLEVLREEKLAEQAHVRGEKLRKALRDMNCPYVLEVRGRGLLNAVVIDPAYHRTAWELCLLLAERGLLAKPTHNNIIRLAPPLILTDGQLDECIAIMKGAFRDLPNIKPEDIPRRTM
jgi:ornithine--oxo-acid transaminase